MAEPEVLQLGVNDLEALFALETAAHPGGWSEEAILVELVHPDAKVFGVRDDGALVAWCALRVVVDELWVLNIATHPNARRRGHADRLLRVAAADGIFGSHLTGTWLEVREGNSGALALYERHGFVRLGRRPNYYPPLPPATAREAAVIMRAPR
jgi:ribosomal-protein-alanine N-acetyltransferase